MLEELLLLNPRIINSLCQVFEIFPFPLKVKDIHPSPLYAGTGDHTFERRLRLGGPLMKENIATMVLERSTSLFMILF